MPNPLHDALWRPHAGSDRPLVRDGATYGDFLEHADRLAHGLAAAGVEPGDRVAVQVHKSVGALALYAACVKSGAVFLPLNTAYTPEEVAYFVSDAEARLLVCDPARLDALEQVASAAGATARTMDEAGDTDLEVDDGPFAAVDRAPGDIASILYTSGTTGRSKGAMLTHANLVSNAEALREAWRWEADDVLLHALPIFHTHGLFVACNVTFLAGASLIFHSRFDAGAALDALPEATTMMGVPTFYTRLLADARLDRAMVAHMRLFTSGSAPLLAETHVEFEARTGHRILERYGMTETNMNTSNPYEGERRAGTVGFALPGIEVRVADAETGEEVAKGEIGGIEVRGPNVFAGYWHMPEKTREEFRDAPDGRWFRTGDLGRFDRDGYLAIVGRSKDLIIAGGYNIYPREIELLIDEMEGVAESAVIGVPHVDFGESVVAVVVPAPGAVPKPDAIMAGLADRLARFKLPRRVEMVDALPRNAMGKVQKNVLRERFGVAP